MATLISRKALNRIVSHMEGVRAEGHHEAKEVGKRAEGYLAAARASTHWHKIHGPSHLTRISVGQGEVDSFVSLEAPNPMAIEFGHNPSGVFGPGGQYGHLVTRPPYGLYILTHATGFTDLSTQ